ncbi:MAG: hypothetical protein VX938_00290, partial [Myxococcota bacterium]|nr:hypothetical protein [Myxococcota bacterium]
MGHNRRDERLFVRLNSLLLSLAVVAAGCASAPGGAPEGTAEDTAVAGDENPPSGDVSTLVEESSDVSAAGDQGSTDKNPEDSGSSEIEDPQDAGTEVAQTGPDSYPDATWLIGGYVAGVGPQNLVLIDGVIAEVFPSEQSPPIGATDIDVEGAWLAPAFIDSHVHIVYLPVAEALVAGGVAAVVDHAAPLSFFQETFGDLRVVGSGPMVTAMGGYPTQSWGANGYGIECAGPEEAVAAVDSLQSQGAAFIKIPFAGGPHLTNDAL